MPTPLSAGRVDLMPVPERHGSTGIDNSSMHFSPTDTAFMQQALAEAEASMHITTPNPRVGCVIVSPDGHLLGQGHTQAAGQAHAEIMALRQAQLAHDVRGATAYVTLEPCAHQGRTGPCCDALIQAGIARVVVSIIDPNPLVAGQGIARMQAAGVKVEIGLLADEAQALNLGFFKRMTQGTPWMRLKVAQSLDGHTALTNGVSQWLTGPLARADGHAWRARACAILTGVGTVRQDNPLLNVREVETPRQPDLWVVDSRLETPLDAALWSVPRRLYMVHAERNAEREAALRDQGATLVALPNPQHKVDLAALVAHLGQAPYNEVHIEAGEKLNGSLLQAGLVDELLVYQAPWLTGPGQGLAALPPRLDLQGLTRWRFHEVQAVGEDLRLRLRRAS